MTNSIAIVGMACRYPGASSPEELWEDVLAQRRSFRRIPPERLRLEDYLCADRDAPDCTYSSEAALIEGYEFDRIRFRIAGSTFRSSDPAHWLALDVAAQALSDAGFSEGEGLPRELTGVLVGNTLTGETSRANVLRLRWPYVRRVVEASLRDEEWSTERLNPFLKGLEIAYKKPFSPVGEESLAGSLSNTIAGRICNYFNLNGGGYTVDGACASSLLAVANACSALEAGDLDAALVGGVDLSLDPFELVGFAKTGALASDLMRIYDEHSNGFFPGEGCGFVLLMRHEDALAQRRRIYAVIKGWGVSSDGSGGITRPEVAGQLLALRRAYHRAGFGIETVHYFEGHGTGTKVGDTAELQALSSARRQAPGKVSSAVIGSIKANIGHTKAAAGVAGLIKTVMAVNANILPPTTGCEQAHSELSKESATLRILRKGEPWPAGQCLRAGVSAMGFGGINTHIVLEGIRVESSHTLKHTERSLLSSAQDAELLLFGARDVGELQRHVEHLLTFAAKLSRAELSDLAAELERKLNHREARAAVVASSPADLATRLEILKSTIESGATTKIDERSGVFLSASTSRPRIGFLFPGQGSPSRLDGGIWPRRFEFLQQLYAQAQLEVSEDSTRTNVAQPAIVTSSLGALDVLSRLNVTAETAIGHSLGELTALHWAGAFDGETLLRTARERGKAMMETGGPAGAMASIAAAREEVEALLNGEQVVIAGLNSPRQTVVSGEATAVAAVMARASAKNLVATRLPVSHAFHSPFMQAAIPVLAKQLSQEAFKPLQRTVISTITGQLLAPETDLRELLFRQITSPVLFMVAATKANSEGVDLWLEVGPGQVVRTLMAQMTAVPVVSLDAGGPSLQGLLRAVGAAFVLGHPVKHEQLFAGRFTRPFNLDWQPNFFVSPCELAPVSETTALSNAAPIADDDNVGTARLSGPAGESALNLVSRLVAQRAELPASAVRNESRLLSDLHLNSITVGQLVADAARALGLPRFVSSTDFADSTVADVARALDRQLQFGQTAQNVEDELLPPGIDSWIRPFSVELVERPLPRRKLPATSGTWQLFAPPDYSLAVPLQQAFNDCGAGSGVIVCLPPAPNEKHLSLLLSGARAILSEKGATRFVLVQHDGGAAAFARTLHLEAPQVTTCVVDVPWACSQVAKWVVAEALAAEGYVEAHYDTQGRRREPVMRPISLSKETTAGLSLDADDVLVVSGGGKGITAECALALAKETGARLALLGLAEPETDVELAQNLQRMTAANINFKYFSTDVTDAEAVRAAVREVEADFGKITGIIHGAARNVPQMVGQLDEEAFQRTLAVKVQGARNLLAAVSAKELRLLITFGSIIARTGLPGEADYGLANEWLVRLTEQWQVAHPACRCLALEWSVWSGVGMGARLGRIDLLVRQGIIPIPPDEGLAMLHQLLSQALPVVSVVVMGRFREMPTFMIERPDLPLLRFLERPRVYYPHVELVVDVDLSTSTDPYLNDHQIQGERLLPAVMGLEAMAQVATALVGATKLTSFQEISFNRPLVVPEIGSLKIRIAALVRDTGLIDVAVRSDETDFQLDHFRATCCVGDVKLEGVEPARPLSENGNRRRSVSIDPERDLYGGILFHRGRFRRLSGYRLLKAKECLAEIAPDGTTSWFSKYLPGQLVLGDPGAHDAAIHAIQACIPSATLLPIGVHRVLMNPAHSSESVFVHAQEREHHDGIFTYDLQVTEADGYVRERWERLRLRAINAVTQQAPWAVPLLGAYAERRVQELIPGSLVSVALEECVGIERHVQSNRVIQLALGEDLAVLRRPDGKPEINGNRAVSASHLGNLTLAVAGDGPLGCDIEQVTERSASAWRDLLGDDRAALAGIITRHAGENEAISATRVWAAGECLKKAGAGFDAPLLFVTSEADSWVLLSSGHLKVATYVTQVRDHRGKLAIAVLVRSNDTHL
jgi:enediyne polyketide synthase